MFKKLIDDIHPFLNQIVQDIDLDKDYYLTTDHYEWYYSFGKIYKPRTILELGVRFGYTASCLIKGTIDVGTKFVEYEGVDIEETVLGSNIIGYTNIKKLFPNEKINIVNADTTTLDPRKLNNKEFDLIHLDASHLEPILLEYDIAYKLLKKGGIMIIDDMFSRAIGEIPEAHINAINQLKIRIDKEFYKGNIKSITHLNTFRGTYIIENF